MAEKKIPHLNEALLFEMGKAEQIQQSQLFDIAGEVEEIKEGLQDLEDTEVSNFGTGKQLIGEMEQLLQSVNFQTFSSSILNDIEDAFSSYEKLCMDGSSASRYDIRKVHEVITNNSWGDYYQNVCSYATRIGIDESEDPFLTTLSENQYKELSDSIDGEFARRTSIKNKTDLKFLLIAIALEVTKGLLYPIIAKKAGYGEKFNPDDRLAHNDKSIERAHKKANDAYKNKHKDKNGTGKWIEFLYRTVPFDTTVGTGLMDDINLHGGSHRLYTLGHDPILGWIFGTANILTDVISIAPGAITPKQEDLNKLEKIFKMVTMRSYRVVRDPKLRVTPEQVSLPTLFKESYEVAREDRMNLPAAIFAEWQHLKSDENTKMGLPVPGIGTFAPDFASKLYSNNYDALCFARDLKIIGGSAVISILIDTIIGLVHGLNYDPKRDGSKDLFEVRTRKILLIANTILIMTYLSGNIKSMDIGGLLVTLSHLVRDTRFFLNVKKEFVENKIYEKIEAELKGLNEIEEGLMQYGYNHGALY